MSIIQITIGDPQPEPCPNCGEKMGYQQSDYIKTHYTSFYNKDGKPEGGNYSDYQPLIHRGKTVSCMNCNEKLPFKFKTEEL